MQIDTKYLGKMEIDEEKIIHFETGIPGFLDEKDFIVLDIPDNNVLQLLQSLHTPSLAFFITNPHQFDPSFYFNLSENVIEMLRIKEKEEVVIFAIMTIRDPFKQSTINFKAPIVINHRTKLGKQIILNDAQYEMRATISSFEEMRDD